MRLALAVLLTLLIAPAAQARDAFLPPAGKVFTGVTGTQSVGSFERETGDHPP